MRVISLLTCPGRAQGIGLYHTGVTGKEKEESDLAWAEENIDLLTELNNLISVMIRRYCRSKQKAWDFGGMVTPCRY